MDNRIKITRKIHKVVDGRTVEETEDHYNCWATISDLLAEEKYEALQLSMEETAVFKVRSCKKIREMRMHLKEFHILLESDKYEIFAMLPVENENKFLLKAYRVN